MQTGKHSIVPAIKINTCVCSDPLDVPSIQPIVLVSIHPPDVPPKRNHRSWRFGSHEGRVDKKGSRFAWKWKRWKPMKLRYSLDRDIRIISCGCFFDVMCDVIWRFFRLSWHWTNYKHQKGHGWMTFHNHQNQAAIQRAKATEIPPRTAWYYGLGRKMFQGCFFLCPLRPCF